ncbi:MAG: hypothetical protein AAF703_16825 [Cyanobacteria bacterium P01_D01_bin.105]
MAAHSEAFFAEISQYPKNKSAERFDQLGAALGFLPNDAQSLNIEPVTPINTKAQKRYLALQPALTYLLTEQLGKTGETADGEVLRPIPSIPPHLAAYLASIQPDLIAIQTHLLAQAPPQWEINLERMFNEDYPFPGLTNVLNTQKLLILSAISYSHQNQPSEMLAALEASWRLNQAVAQRPDLVAQIAASITADYQSTLLRHTENLSQAQLSQWQHRFSQQIQQQRSVLDGVRFNVWLQYQSLQQSLSKVTESSNLLAVFSPVHQFAIANIDTAQTAHRTIDLLRSTNVCETSESAIEVQLATIQTAEWNDAIAPLPAGLATRWKQESDRTLSLELTQQVLNAKQHYQQHQQWPNHESQTVSQQLRSRACPNEHWVYTLKDDNTLHIRLSAEPVSIPSQSFQMFLTLPVTD